MKMHKRVWNSKILQTLTCFFLSILVCVSSTTFYEAKEAIAPVESSQQQTGAKEAIKINQQSFFEELNAISERWNKSYLGHVQDKSPKGTILRFYAVMHQVSEKAKAITERASTEPGIRWSKETQQEIAEAEALFTTAIQALDGSEMPESFRANLKEEAALKLKEILDFVFENAKDPISLPDLNQIEILNKKRTKPSSEWRLPRTAITLTREIQNDPENQDYYFSIETLENINRMHNFVEEANQGNPESKAKQSENSFGSPNIYESYTYTPGRLVPPKLYLFIPSNIRNILEWPVGEQSIFQILLAITIIAIYSPITVFLISSLLKTYKFGDQAELGWIKRIWKEDSVAWSRFLYAVPIAPLSYISGEIISNYINLTGSLLVGISSIFDVIIYLSLGISAVFLFEALGRSSSAWILYFRGGNSSLELKRLSNIILPVSRFLGAIASVALIYNLLLQLGMPANAVLAFSAVPGLAIGLGASKLLGNIFAGISIQSDRPLRVGEFCKVGSDMGFVKRIGLRSIELSTLSGRITIPNNKVDDATIVNYSTQSISRKSGPEKQPKQSIELLLEVPDGIGIGQLKTIVSRSKQYIENQDKFIDAFVNYDEDSSGKISLSVHTSAKVDDWLEYLALKQSLLTQIKLIIAVAKNLKRSISVPYDTAPEKLSQIPIILSEIINSDKDLSMGACRMLKLSDYSLDFIYSIKSNHSDVGEFFDSIEKANKEILIYFKRYGIEIALPTSIEIRKT